MFKNFLPYKIQARDPPVPKPTSKREQTGKLRPREKCFIQSDYCFGNLGCNLDFENIFQN